ncbi:MAG: DUF6516 family protein [Desulfuromonadales bacterium]
MITSNFDEIRQALILNELVTSFKIVREMTGSNDGFIRVKCRLSDGSILEFAEYLQIVSGKIVRKTYSYHWQTSRGTLRRRWDNAPHHPEITTFPDHQHNGDLVVESKPMTLVLVLIAIENIFTGANQ